VTKADRPAPLPRRGWWLLLVAVVLVAAGLLRGDWGQAADLMTYGNFDAPPSEGQAGVMYLGPGTPDLAVEKVYDFAHGPEWHPLVALGILFVVILAWRTVKAPDLGARRWLVQWLTFVGTRLGVLRVGLVLPVPRCALGVTPLLNCQMCEMAVGACPIAAVQGGLRAGQLPALALGVILGAGAIAGRWFCGWMCPFGLIEDLMGRVARLWSWRLRLPRALEWGRFGVLGFVLVGGVLAVPLGFETVLPFCATLCASGKVLGLAPYYLTTGISVVPEAWPTVLFHGALLLLWAGLTLAVAGRVFCRLGCPLGAALGLMNDTALVRIEGDAAACAACGACRSVCPMGASYEDPGFLARTGCIRCGRCVSRCHRANRRWVFPAVPRASDAQT